eukprot:1001778_1
MCPRCTSTVRFDCSTTIRPRHTFPETTTNSTQSRLTSSAIRVRAACSYRAPKTARLNFGMASRTSLCMKTIMDARGGDEVSSVAFSRDGSVLLSGGKDSALKICDFVSGRELTNFQ